MVSDPLDLVVYPQICKAVLKQDIKTKTKKDKVERGFRQKNSNHYHIRACRNQTVGWLKCSSIMYFVLKIAYFKRISSKSLAGLKKISFSLAY